LSTASSTSQRLQLGDALEHVLVQEALDEVGGPFSSVTVVIPGACNVAQAQANSGTLEPVDSAMIAQVYDQLIRPHVHDRW
jgi:hypothetical protein